MQKLSVLIGQIDPVFKSKKNDNWFEAWCPLCGTSKEATVLGSLKGAEKIACKGSVITHLKSNHKGEFEDDTD